jgi:hypothetical protein
MIDKLLNNRFYLSLFIVASVLITGYTLSEVANLLSEHLIVDYSFEIEALLVLGQILFQWIFMLNRTWLDKFRYMVLALGISLFGALLLLPLIVYSYFELISSVGVLTYFFSVVIIMFLKHIQEIKHYHLPLRLAFSWGLYRVLILVVIAKPFY